MTPDVSPSNRPWSDVVRQRLGLGLIEPAQPVVGIDAGIRWWDRARAFLILAALVVILGLALAAAIGAFIFVGGFLLEQAIS